jgi:hypothetical protein
MFRLPINLYYWVQATKLYHHSEFLEAYEKLSKIKTKFPTMLIKINLLQASCLFSIREFNHSISYFKKVLNLLNSGEGRLKKNDIHYLKKYIFQFLLSHYIDNNNNQMIEEVHKELEQLTCAIENVEVMLLHYFPIHNDNFL